MDIVDAFGGQIRGLPESVAQLLISSAQEAPVKDSLASYKESLHGILSCSIRLPPTLDTKSALNACVVVFCILVLAFFCFVLQEKHLASIPTRTPDSKTVQIPQYGLDSFFAIHFG